MKILAAEQPPTPWKNGGGLARDLLLWPSAADWWLRISLADITTDGPFSAWPGVQRWFAVTRGAGVRLHGAGGQAHTQRPADGPWCFDGGQALQCTLIDGSVQALNLMLRSGASGLMQTWALTEDWPEQARFDVAAGCLHWPWRGPGVGLHLGARPPAGMPRA